MAGSETRRVYIPVGLGPASMRATASEPAIATHVYAGRSQFCGKTVGHPYFHLAARDEPGIASTAENIGSADTIKMTEILTATQTNFCATHQHVCCGLRETRAAANSARCEQYMLCKHPDRHSAGPCICPTGRTLKSSAGSRKAEQ